MSMLAFFPWLKIAEEIEIRDIKLIPFVVNEEDNSAFHATCRRIIKPYVGEDNQPIGKAILVVLNGKDNFEDYSEDERNYLFSIVEILSFSGLSRREYFRFGYCNYSDFMFIVQGFQANSDGVAVVTRRRDGKTTKYVMGDDYQVKAPDSVNHNNSVTFDIHLIEALLMAQDQVGDKWLEYADAIFSFNRANTDDAQVPEYQEVVMIISSFQRLLDAGHKEDVLVNNFHSLFKPQEDFDSKLSNRIKGSKYEDKGKTLREVLMVFRFRLTNKH